MSAEKGIVSPPFRIKLIALLALMGAISSGFSIFRPVYPAVPFTNGMFFFGNYAVVYVAIFALINLYIAIGFFRLQKAAWFIYVIFSSISIIVGLFITFTVSDAALFGTMFQMQQTQPELPLFFYKFFGFTAMLIYVLFLIYVVSQRNLFFKKKR